MRLIDADALLNHVWDADTRCGYVQVVDRGDIEEATTVVELVRCKDCIYRDSEDKKCDCGHDIVWQLPRDDNWFCADGERRKK